MLVFPGVKQNHSFLFFAAAMLLLVHHRLSMTLQAHLRHQSATLLFSKFQTFCFATVILLHYYVTQNLVGYCEA